ncbi:MAG: D-amino acid aminotransferase [Planctomycetes bacterium]|nr:D-amino acid aminotransferase [Planctomycetota bacterium]NOG54811.1 D-amino acid aminotransferase [Planctomycetota bacterium]
MMQVYLNGSFVDSATAMVPAMDRGFLFGDGVYEVVRYFDGRPVDLDGHVERLRWGLDQLEIRGFDAPDIGPLGSTLLTHNRLKDAATYWHVTRGTEPIRSHVPAVTGLTPTVFGFCWQLPPLSESQNPQAVEARLYPDVRWARCDIKSLNLMGSVLAKMEAAKYDAAEAILHRDGFVTEGSTTNVWIVNEAGTVITPPTDEGNPILHGITRKMLIGADVDVQVRPVPIDALMSAQEVMLTSTTRLMVAVTAVDGIQIGDGRVGPVCRRLYDALLRVVINDTSASAATT